MAPPKKSWANEPPEYPPFLIKQAKEAEQRRRLAERRPVQRPEPWHPLKDKKQ